MKTISPLVGAHFRPPAKAILAALPAATPLILEREHNNPYDPNAVKVLVEPKHIPESQYDDLTMVAQGYGFTAEEICAEPKWHLGYIAAKPPKGRSGTLAATVASHMDNGAYPFARLGFDGTGEACVEIEWSQA
jgi:hypothetical protein